MPQYRMTWRREARWLLASYLVNWALKLVLPEAGPDVLKGFHALAENFTNDPHYDTVRMRRTSQ